MARVAASNDNAALLSASARDWREGRRLRAMELLAQGYRGSEVARVLGVTPGAVSQWSKRAQSGGASALLRRQRLGRDRRLDSSQLAALRAFLLGDEAPKPCTIRAVAALIERQWGVSYSRAHVSRILKALGVRLDSAPLGSARRASVARV